MDSPESVLAVQTVVRACDSSRPWEGGRQTCWRVEDCLRRAWHSLIHPDPGTSHGARAWIRDICSLPESLPLPAGPFAPSQPERVMSGLFLSPLSPPDGDPPDALACT